ncbi:hypothetical protein DERF_009811 [Dermatophagoides farinae]|uniref:Uncharacterized protein n=1 Tax=Dermatophagoides farinae TaxID=6954 RepID=A0A922L652_DERFA|nr:hypothetical protein DERF_009811 [Dermatophagoides farinae]
MKNKILNDFKQGDKSNLEQMTFNLWNNTSIDTSSASNQFFQVSSTDSVDSAVGVERLESWHESTQSPLSQMTISNRLSMNNLDPNQSLGPINHPPSSNLVMDDLFMNQMCTLNIDMSFDDRVFFGVHNFSQLKCSLSESQCNVDFSATNNKVAIIGKSENVTKMCKSFFLHSTFVLQFEFYFFDEISYAEYMKERFPTLQTEYEKLDMQLGFYQLGRVLPNFMSTLQMPIVSRDARVINASYLESIENETGTKIKSSRYHCQYYPYENIIITGADILSVFVSDLTMLVKCISSLNYDRSSIEVTISPCVSNPSLDSKILSIKTNEKHIDKIYSIHKELIDSMIINGVISEHRIDTFISIHDSSNFRFTTRNRNFSLFVTFPFYSRISTSYNKTTVSFRTEIRFELNPPYATSFNNNLQSGLGCMIMLPIFFDVTVSSLANSNSTCLSSGSISKFSSTVVCEVLPESKIQTFDDFSTDFKIKFDRSMHITITHRCLSVYLHHSDSIDSNFAMIVSSHILLLLLSFIMADFVLVQFLSGHGNFRHYLYKIGYSSESLCWCEMDTQNSVRLICSCPRFLIFRTNIENLCGLSLCKETLPV